MGARRWPDARLRLGGMRDCGRRGAGLGSMDRKGTVRLPGGDLIIEWRAADGHVLMSGPVEYEGAFILDEILFEAAAP